MFDDGMPIEKDTAILHGQVEMGRRRPAGDQVRPNGEHEVAIKRPRLLAQDRYKIIFADPAKLKLSCKQGNELWMHRAFHRPQAPLILIVKR
jgi:hypothetical protein